MENYIYGVVFSLVFCFILIATIRFWKSRKIVKKDVVNFVIDNKNTDEKNLVLYMVYRARKNNISKDRGKILEYFTKNFENFILEFTVLKRDGVLVNNKQEVISKAVYKYAG